MSVVYNVMKATALDLFIPKVIGARFLFICLFCQTSVGYGCLSVTHQRFFHAWDLHICPDETMFDI